MNENQRCLYVTQMNPSILIRNIVTILEHRVTRHDRDRHKEMIRNFIQISKNGFLIKDLAYIMRTMEILYQIQDDTFEHFMEDLLDTCSIPPILTLSSDKITYASDMQELFSFLGYLLLTVKKDTRTSVVRVISKLLKKNAEQKWYASLEFRRSAVADSKLPEILGQLLDTADDQLYPELLRLIIILTRSCLKSYKVLIDTDALNSILRRIEPTWRERYPNTQPLCPTSKGEILHFDDTFVITCMLLNHLEKNKEDLAGVNNIDRFSIWNLQYVYQVFSRSQIENLNKNNVTSLILRLMNLFPVTEFIVSGFIEDFITLNALYNFQNHDVEAMRNMTASEEDYNYIKLMLLSIPIIAKLEGGLRILEKVRIIYRLLKIVSRPDGHLVQFPKAHSCVIQIFCWDVLKKLVPFLEEEFIEYSGPHILLECMKIKNITEEGLTILVKCLGAINHMLKFDSNEIIINSILYNDGINIMIKLLEDFLTYPTFNNPVQNCLKKLFSALTMLCRFSDKDNFEAVPLALKYLRRFLVPDPEETVYDNRILISLMDFIWEIIVKSEKLSVIFIKEEGVFVMLDIVQAFPFPVQIITLGALVDLCENERCVPYLITWIGKPKTQLLSLLMKLFREENKRLQVKMDFRGRISDPVCPLMGKDQRDQTFNGRKELHSNPSISDLFLSARPKIYALLNLLNERHQVVVQQANEHYKTMNDTISAEDQMTMLLADNYLALKLGEAWREVAIEFEILKFVPTQTDTKIISSLLLRAEKWGQHLKKTQSEILQQDHHDERLKEQKLYIRIGESCISQALEAVSELKYIARSIERMFRISQKHKQQNQVEKILTRLPYSEFLHRTYNSGVRVTPVFNLSVSVQSNIIDEQKEEPVTPVSPEESEVRFERKHKDESRNSEARSEDITMFSKLDSSIYSQYKQT